MRVWISRHGLRSCEAHGLNRYRDRYVSQPENLAMLRGPIEFHFVGDQPDWWDEHSAAMINHPAIQATVFEHDPEWSRGRCDVPDCPMARHEAQGPSVFDDGHMTAVCEPMLAVNGPHAGMIVWTRPTRRIVVIHNSHQAPAYVGNAVTPSAAEPTSTYTVERVTQAGRGRSEVWYELHHTDETPPARPEMAWPIMARNNTQVIDAPPPRFRSALHVANFRSDPTSPHPDRVAAQAISLLRFFERTGVTITASILEFLEERAAGVDSATGDDGSAVVVFERRAADAEDGRFRGYELRGVWVDEFESSECACTTEQICDRCRRRTDVGNRRAAEHGHMHQRMDGWPVPGDTVDDEIEEHGETPDDWLHRVAVMLDEED